MNLINDAFKSLKLVSELEPAAPLYQRVPTRNERGEMCADFMMLIPQLNKRYVPEQQRVCQQLGGVLQYYEQVVLFAELNLQRNTLWVSHQPVHGIGLEIAAAIFECVPEARLIAQYYE